MRISSLMPSQETGIHELMYCKNAPSPRTGVDEAVTIYLFLFLYPTLVYCRFGPESIPLLYFPIIHPSIYQPFVVPLGMIPRAGCAEDVCTV